MSNEATEWMVYVPCRCGSAHHFLRIQDDPDIPDAVCVEFLSGGTAAPFWMRMKHALKHLFWREELVYAELFIDRDTLKAAIEARE